MRTYASDVHTGRQGREPSGGDYMDVTVAFMMLDRYGLGYICQHPKILFADPRRPTGDIASRMYGRGEYANRQEANVPYEPETLLDRMAEAYRILDRIFSPYG